ncbi:hypothetical protein Ntsu_79010 [Nocardia sp. IFM 10818]
MATTSPYRPRPRGNHARVHADRRPGTARGGNWRALRVGSGSYRPLMNGRPVLTSPSDRHAPAKEGYPMSDTHILMPDPGVIA